MHAAITPLPPDLLADRPPTILVFGGTFDPPHLGHVQLPLAVRNSIDTNAWLLYIPAARSPHKGPGPHARPAQRMEMLALALTGVPRAALWTDEIDRAAGFDTPSYTVDTLARLRHALDNAGLGQTSLRLLIGADQALGFHRWRDPRGVIELAEPAVLCRGALAQPEHIASALARFDFWTPGELQAWRTRLLHAPPIDASSTALRSALAAEDFHTAGRFLHPGVLAYIRTHNLYHPGTGP